MNDLIFDNNEFIRGIQAYHFLNAINLAQDLKDYCCTIENCNECPFNNKDNECDLFIPKQWNNKFLKATKMESIYQINT